jgi:DNA-binding transcriptional ArsR family regulator
MLEVLREGPSTASRLARALGESSGATSYHLRVLAKAGLVEDEAERRNGRERWWRRATPILYIPTGEDPELRAAEIRVRSVLLERDEQAMQRFLVHEDELDPALRSAAFVGGWSGWATAEELEELGKKVFALVDELRGSQAERPRGARPIYFTFRAVPWFEADA